MTLDLDALKRAKFARTVARTTSGPLVYAAWRYVTTCEADLDDEQHDAYQRWARTEKS